MSKIERMTEIAKGMLKPGEKIDRTIDGKELAVGGKMVYGDFSGTGNEIIDGLLAATNHRLLVVMKPFIGSKTDSFTYAQVSSMSLDRERDEISMCTPGKVFALYDIDQELATEFVREFNDKKQPKRATVDVGVTMKKEK